MIFLVTLECDSNSLASREQAEECNEFWATEVFSRWPSQANWRPGDLGQGQGVLKFPIQEQRLF